MLVQLTKKQLKEIEKFCVAVQEARKGRDKKNNDEGEHRIKREMVGKIGELAACVATGIGQVDFAIYDSKELLKNCDYDLADGIHVKTCEASAKGTKFDGWLISVWEKWLNDPTSLDAMIFCYADDKGQVDVIGWLYVSEIRQLIRPPVSRKLSHKVAVYAEDIIKYIRNIELLKSAKNPQQGGSDPAISF